jgi:DNA-binding MarR family transcriptional regulator
METSIVSQETKVQDHVAGIVAQWAVERPDLDASPLLVLGRISWLANAMEHALRPPFAAEGLGNGDFDVLTALRRAGRPYALRHRDLTAAMLVTPGAVTKRVDRLVEKGYVARAAADEDGRGQLVRLTRAGVRFVDRMIEVHLANEARMLSGLGDRDRQQLARLLGKLAASLG